MDGDVAGRRATLSLDGLWDFEFEGPTTSEITEAVLWLASEQSSYVVGQDLVVDGGTTA